MKENIPINQIPSSNPSSNSGSSSNENIISTQFQKDFSKEEKELMKPTLDFIFKELESLPEDENYDDEIDSNTCDAIKAFNNIGKNEELVSKIENAFLDILFNPSYEENYPENFKKLLFFASNYFTCSSISKKEDLPTSDVFASMVFFCDLNCVEAISNLSSAYDSDKDNKYVISCLLNYLPLYLNYLSLYIGQLPGYTESEIIKLTSDIITHSEKINLTTEKVKKQPEKNNIVLSQEQHDVFKDFFKCFFQDFLPESEEEEGEEKCSSSNSNKRKREGENNKEIEEKKFKLNPKPPTTLIKQNVFFEKEKEKECDLDKDGFKIPKGFPPAPPSKEKSKEDSKKELFFNDFFSNTNNNENDQEKEKIPPENENTFFSFGND